MQAIHQTCWKTQLDWADSNPHSSRRVKETNLPAIWSQPGSSEPVTKGQNAQQWCTWTSGHYLQWYIKSSYTVLNLPAHIAVYGAVNCVATLNHTITHCIIADIYRRLWCSPRQVNGGGGSRLSLKIGRWLQANEGNSCHISTSGERKGMNRFQTKNSCTFTVIGLNSDFIPTVWLCKWSFSMITEAVIKTQLKNKPEKHRHHYSDN